MAVALAAAACLSGTAWAAGPQQDPPWVTAQVEGGQLETPQGWRDRSRLQQGLFFRQGDGIVVPAFDETGAPLQVGLIVLKVRPELSLDQAAQDVERGEATGNT